MSDVGAVWNKLETFLNRLYNLDEAIDDWFTPDLYMSLYTMVYEYCVAKNTQSTDIQGRDLYTSLCAFYTNLPALPSHPVALLLQWRRYEQAALRVEAVFQYLDRFWVAREGAVHVVPLLWESWWGRMRGEEERLLAWAEGCLTAERAAGTVQPNADLKELFRIYHAISTVPEESLLLQAMSKTHSKSATNSKSATQSKSMTVSHPFLDHLLPWYCNTLQQDSTELLSRLSTAQMPTVGSIGIMLSFWKGEMERVARYLTGPSLPNKTVEKRTKETMKAAILLPLLPILRDQIVRSMETEEDPTETIQLIYNLVAQRKSLLKELVPSIETGLLARLTAKVPRQGAKAEQMSMLINLMFAMYQDARRIVSVAMMDEPMMLAASDTALKRFISDSPSAPAMAFRALGEHLARWVDTLIRDQEEFVPKIPFILTLLRYLEDKESFQKWYARLLSRRLLARQSFYQRDGEEALLTQLAATYGHGYVSNLRRMLVDMESSLQVSQQFLGRHKRAKLPFELSFQILTFGCWPASPDEAVLHWERRLHECLDSFAEFYGEQHTGRVLTWSPSLTTAEVVATFSQRPFSFILSAAQVAILLQLQDRPSTLIELSTITGLVPPLVQSSLMRLLQVQLVLSHADTLRLNHSFVSPHSRLNLSIAAETEIVVGLPKDVVEDRTFMLQARLVKYLKAHSQCTKAELTALVGESELEKTLQMLQEKEYLSVEGDQVVYIP
ncbi:Cullin-1 [Paramicrosporidium saccamoebae]|uniref:Cullin-1 n=1 Tax=Paramicrosporidium saccamoebae TaxID=1246581 RepID=A0A2H9TKV3_9FUNG|nr:Cullin-1 [Paramicrosporidium saccamoebae]